MATKADWQKHEFISWPAAAQILGVSGSTQISYMIGQGKLVEAHPDIYWGEWATPPRFVTGESIRALKQGQEARNE